MANTEMGKGHRPKVSSSENNIHAQSARYVGGHGAPRGKLYTIHTVTESAHWGGEWFFYRQHCPELWYVIFEAKHFRNFEVFVKSLISARFQLYLRRALAAWACASLMCHTV